MHHEKAMPFRTRREVLLAATAGSVAAAARESLPAVKLGPHTVSRLILGMNPISGNSHVSPQLSAEMRDYFTVANIKKLLANCERAGINAGVFRGDRHIIRLMHEYRQGGGRMQCIAVPAPEYGDFAANLREIAALEPIAIYHHGTMTDRYWMNGKIDEVYERIKIMRQSGATIGLGSHLPEVIDYVESKGWDVDFYMTCVYQIVQGDTFRDADREKMLARVRQTQKQCLIFKVYGATRHCATAETRLAALELAFRYAKPTDAVVIGMYPKVTEQVRENCRLVMRAMARTRAT
jgi:hypothetical protein